ncbi:MAG: hypothetical protein AAF547_13395 [Actinomycetota bacterium]
MSPAEIGWWSTTADLDLPIRCGGEVHHLRWRRGVVDLADHPDLAGEVALAGFGGAEPPCLTTYRLWCDAVADGGFLGEWVDPARLGPAWFSWLTMALERMRAEGFHEFLRRLPPQRALRMGEFLDRFPNPWLDRAAAVVSHRLDHAPSEVPGGWWPTDETPPPVACQLAQGLVAEASAARVRRAFVDAVGGSRLAVGAAALVPLTITTDDRPLARGRLTGPERAVRLTVPPGWLHRVWAAGGAVIDGRLVLDLRFEPSARSAAPGPISATAVSVDWGPGPADGPTLTTDRVALGPSGWAGLRPSPPSTGAAAAGRRR